MSDLFQSWDYSIRNILDGDFGLQKLWYVIVWTGMLSSPSRCIDLFLWILFLLFGVLLDVTQIHISAVDSVFWMSLVPSLYPICLRSKLLDMGRSLKIVGRGAAQFYSKQILPEKLSSSFQIQIFDIQVRPSVLKYLFGPNKTVTSRMRFLLMVIYFMSFNFCYWHNSCCFVRSDQEKSIWFLEGRLLMLSREKSNRFGGWTSFTLLPFFFLFYFQKKKKRPLHFQRPRKGPLILYFY